MIERTRLIEVGQCLGKRATIQVYQSPPAIRYRRFWIQPDRLIVVGDGAVEVAFVHVDESAAGEVIEIFRIQPDRLIVVGDGAVEVPFSEVSVAAVVVRNSQVLAAFPTRINRGRAAFDLLIIRVDSSFVVAPVELLLRRRACRGASCFMQLAILEKCQRKHGYNGAAESWIIPKTPKAKPIEK